MRIHIPIQGIKVDNQIGGAAFEDVHGNRFSTEIGFRDALRLVCDAIDAGEKLVTVIDNEMVI